MSTSHRITYICANNGKLHCYADFVLVASARTAEALADTIVDLNLDFSDAAASSTMHFASEEGFAYDTEAFEIFNKAIELSACYEYFKG